MSLSIKQARKLAAFLYGPSAQVKRHNEPTRRDARFAIYFTNAVDSQDGFGGGKLAVYVAGCGDSWDKAFAVAKANPVAEAKVKEIEEKRKTLNQKMAELNAAPERQENNDGIAQ